MAQVARDIMVRDVICIPEGMDLRDLSKLFLEKSITGAPVVDDDGNLVGVISQTDLLYYHITRDDELVLPNDFYSTARVEGRHLPSGFQIEDVNTGSVADVMTPVVHAVAETAEVEAVARMMARRHIHRVIVRRGRKVAGIISALDILRAVARGTRRGTSRKKAKAKPRRGKVGTRA